MDESKTVPDLVAQDRGKFYRAREVEWRDHIECAAKGDQQGLARLYDETSSLVYGSALRILGNSADAEEVTSDVYTQVWRNAGSFSVERGSVNAWLMMLTRSRAIDRLRSRSRTRTEEPLEDVAEMVAGSDSPEQASMARQRSERVRAALSTISPEQRQAIELAYFSGLTQSELAAHLGQPLGTVKTRIRLGMMKLKEQLRSEDVIAAS
jgi:RNA polymerase sigma-70 factor (ECF subfamily)